MVRKKTFLFRQWSMQGAVVTAAISLMLTSGVSTQAAVDETEPATYPKEIVDDWKAKDGTNFETSIAAIKTKYPDIASKITKTGEAGYLQACHYRRIARMKTYLVQEGNYPGFEKLIYAKHHDIGGAIIGYTEDLKGDGVQGLGDWKYPGSSRSGDYGSGGNSGIYMLNFTNYYPSPSVVIEDKTGVLKDPCPSPNGKYLVYAHSKDNNGYHINEYDFDTKKSRQLTDNLGSIHVSDYEPCVLPTGDIVFNSSRCFGTVDCNINLVSNLFLINKDGKYMRRLGYDQVNIFYPTLMEDGGVMYTRWEYNDRNVANCFGIFTMLQDGSRQQEWFGNQTTWPATFSQARVIPGTSGKQALAIIGGHQGPYAGDLVVVDNSLGRNNIGGKTYTKLIAPRREKASGGGGADMDGVPPADKLFQNPYPLLDETFLISYRKTTSDKYRIYCMDFDGNRELIAWDASKSVSQPVSMMAKEIKAVPQFQADYTKKIAKVSVANVYYGMGMKGVTSGVKKVRVVGMEYRTDPAFGNTGSMSYQMTPVGRFGCSWEAKYIIGEAPVAADGSAAFEVPPNVPLFLQLIAEDGTMLQTMRSWMTLKPDETFECAGCHEDKTLAPPSSKPTNQTPKPLDKFYDLSGAKGSFYYPKVIQPVLDANCVKSACHDASHTKLNLTATKIETNSLSDDDNSGAFRSWNTSYYNLSKSAYVNCNAIFGSAAPISPKALGSPRSAVITKLKGGHVKGLPQEAIDKIAAWIDLSIPHSGTYSDDMSPENAKKYLERVARRDQQEAYEAKNIEEWIAAGQYCVAPYNKVCNGIAVSKPDGNNTIKTNSHLFSAAFIAKTRQLSVNLPSEGQIKLLDLQGRQILAQTVTREAFAESASQSFKLKLSAGTYIVKFDGSKVTSEQVLSVL